MAHTAEQLNEWFAAQMQANTANVYYYQYPTSANGQVDIQHVPKDDLAQLPSNLTFNMYVGGLPMFVVPE